ncbi:MAG: small basic protein [Candidatus Omnitrophica bacterium]|nr:small basic protein [Candidatus Omnitrophota bacterium]MBL7151711.1 small basic protein [Candidatus Omnitrophota bacterium]
MSIHPSLNTPEKDKKHRSVLKRAERLKMMIEKGNWKEGDRVYGLPKIKTLKIKIKKEKAEKPQEELATEGAAAPAAGAAEAKPAAKEAPAKAAAKEKEKK